MIQRRNSSSSGRKREKGHKKAVKSVTRAADMIDQDFYVEFQCFYQQATKTRFTKYEFMREFFNLGLESFPEDEEISRIQKQILTTSGQVRNLKKNWTSDEKKVLIWCVGKVSQINKEDLRDLSEQSWDQIARMMCRRDADQCKIKWASMQKIALQQSPFTLEEDQRLFEIIQNYQQLEQGQKWSLIANELNQFTTIYRSSKQCRERWLNHLNPKISKEPWTDEEDIQLLNYVKQYGRRWAEISKILEGRRSENNLKNRFNSLVKREKDLTVKSTDGSANNLDDLLSGCIGPEINERQRKAIDVLLEKLHWRQGQYSQALNPVPQIQQSQRQISSRSLQQLQQHSQPLQHSHSQQPLQNQRLSTPVAQNGRLRDKRSSIQLPDIPRMPTQTYVHYLVGNMDSDVNLHDLTPCLVDVNRSMIYFCTSDTIQQFLQNQACPRDNFEKIKSELSVFDLGFQKFKSTLSMIEEVENSHGSQQSMNMEQNKVASNELDQYFNFETPDIWSSPMYVTPIEIISQKALQFVRKQWKSENVINLQAVIHRIPWPKSVPNINLINNL